MAEGHRYICRVCDHEIEAWSDGNPYYMDDSGEKQYAYHPDHDLLEKCIGNDTPHLCLYCGHEFMVDSRDPITECPGCTSHTIMDTYNLEGKQCPYCKKGLFESDPNFHAIS